MKTSACTILTVLLATPPGAIPSHALQQEAAAMRQEAKEPQRQDGTAPPERRDAPSVSFGLEDATPVKLGTARELSSASDRTGDRVDFEVLEDVCAKNVVIIPKGGIAWGTITDAKPRRRLGRAGKLEVTIDEVRLADGERVPLRAVRDVQGKGRQGIMTGAMIASGILFFPAVPLFLFIHGRDITIPKGSEVTAYVNGDSTLDPAKFKNDAAAQPSAPGDSRPADSRPVAPRM